MCIAEFQTRLPSLSSQPSGDLLFRIGLDFSTGISGKTTDPVTALALFDLAARRGSLEAKVYRRELGDELELGQVMEAQQLARDWLAGRAA